jgi:hypothetical protein
LFVFTRLTGAKAVTAGAFAVFKRFGDLAAPNKSDSRFHQCDKRPEKKFPSFHEALKQQRKMA